MAGFASVVLSPSVVDVVPAVVVFIGLAVVVVGTA